MAVFGSDVNLSAVDKFMLSFQKKENNLILHVLWLRKDEGMVLGKINDSLLYCDETRYVSMKLFFGSSVGPTVFFHHNIMSFPC